VDLRISEAVHDPPSKIAFRSVKIYSQRVLAVHRRGRVCIIL